MFPVSYSLFLCINYIDGAKIRKMKIPRHFYWITLTNKLNLFQCVVLIVAADVPEEGGVVAVVDILNA